MKKVYLLFICLVFISSCNDDLVMERNDILSTNNIEISILFVDNISFLSITKSSLQDDIKTKQINNKYTFFIILLFKR